MNFANFLLNPNYKFLDKILQGLTRGIFEMIAVSIFKILQDDKNFKILIEKSRNNHSRSWLFLLENQS